MVHVKIVLSRGRGKFLSISRKAMAPPRRKGPVGQQLVELVATKGAPRKCEVEEYVVDMEAGQLARLKDAATMPSEEVYVVIMGQSVNNAAKKGVPTMPSKEESV